VMKIIGSAASSSRASSSPLRSGNWMSSTRHAGHASAGSRFRNARAEPNEYCNYRRVARNPPETLDQQGAGAESDFDQSRKCRQQKLYRNVRGRMARRSPRARSNSKNNRTAVRRCCSVAFDKKPPESMRVTVALLAPDRLGWVSSSPTYRAIASCDVQRKSSECSYAKLRKPSIAYM
jgi:hypothetical protein